MLPIIGIPAGDLGNKASGLGALGHAAGEAIFLPATYALRVQEAGGLAVVLPPPGDTRREAAAYLDRVHGLLLAGGPDVDPRLWGEEPWPELGRISPRRDRWELALARGALARGMPVLGICRGCQVLAVAAGGRVVQDLAAEFARHPGKRTAPLKHYQDAPEIYPTHTVRLAADSRLCALLGRSVAAVNSFHHQAVRRPGRGLRAVAWAADGVVEGIEAVPRRGSAFQIGVQWHAETLAAGDAGQARLFQGLVRAAATYMR